MNILFRFPNLLDKENLGKVILIKCVRELQCF